MQALLDFLYSVSSRVLLFFGDLWTQALDIVRNIRAFILGEVAKVNAGIRDVVVAVTAPAFNLINRSIDAVYPTLDNLLERVGRLEANPVGFVGDALNALRAEFTDLINSTFAGVLETVNAGVTQATQAADGVKEIVSAGIDEVNQRVDALRVDLADIRAWLTAARRSQIDDLISNTLPRLKSFIQDPAGFILSAIKNDVADWFAGILADLME